MAKSKIIKANEKIAEKVTSGFQKVSDTVVSGYLKIEDKFVDQYLTKEGESVEEAKNVSTKNRKKKRALRPTKDRMIKDKNKVLTKYIICTGFFLILFLKRKLKYHEGYEQCCCKLA